MQEVMNRLLSLDPEAIEGLINMRVECNEAMSDDKTAQVQYHPGKNQLGILGILNAILGDAGVEDYLVIRPTSTGKFTFGLMDQKDAIRTLEP